MAPNNRPALEKRYRDFCAKGLELDLSRGKPEPRQLDLSLPMLALEDFHCEDGTDVRSYGDPLGIPEARRLFGELLEAPPEQVIVGGSSSLNLIYDLLTRALLHGPLPGDTPWGQLPRVRFLCPVPGYDWHFHMLQMLGIQCVSVPMGEGGPDMALVEALARADPTIKGILCVPMYSNPTGITFSAETVHRLARMETAAPDFRILWDNAYCVHHLYPDQRDHLESLLTACQAAGTENRPLLFTSTSKITFAGGGVSALAASPANISRQADLMRYQMVCYDKVNQWRHARFLPNLTAVEGHMARHGDILRPKFALVQQRLQEELGGLVRWRKPLGGYFICLELPPGCAQKTVSLCKKAGITLTPAGAPFPGGLDPRDAILRIAPTYPPLQELEQVMELLPLAIRLAVLDV